MAHYYSTGREIAQQVSDDVDGFMAGVGTGGRLMDVGKALRERNPSAKLVAVQPEEAAVLSGRKDVKDHKIAGIGDGLVLEVLDKGMIGEVITVKSDDAVEMAKRLSRTGITSRNIVGSKRLGRDSDARSDW